MTPWNGRFLPMLERILRPLAGWSKAWADFEGLGDERAP
jgi:hypothetical protein